MALLDSLLQQLHGVLADAARVAERLGPREQQPRLQRLLRHREREREAQRQRAVRRRRRHVLLAHEARDARRDVVEELHTCTLKLHT